MTKFPLRKKASFSAASESHKVEKVTKNNSRIISKPRVYLQSMAKTYAKFHKDRYRRFFRDVFPVL